jgi:hypothetical protein
VTQAAEEQRTNHAGEIEGAFINAIHSTDHTAIGFTESLANIADGQNGMSFLRR